MLHCSGPRGPISSVVSWNCQCCHSDEIVQELSHLCTQFSHIADSFGYRISLSYWYRLTHLLVLHNSYCFINIINNTSVHLLSCSLLCDCCGDSFAYHCKHIFVVCWVTWFFVTQILLLYVSTLTQYWNGNSLCQSVCLTVCLSHASVVYKWLHVSSKFFTTWKACSLICMSWNGITEWQHLQCVDTHSMWRKCDSWPIFLPYIVKNFHITFMPWSSVALYVSSVVMSLNFLCIICDIHSVAVYSVIYFLTNVNIIFCRGELWCMFLWLEMQRNLTLKSASSFLYVGSYVAIVVASLLLYYIASLMDPGYVLIVNQVPILLTVKS